MKITAEFDSLSELRAFADLFHQTPTVASLPHVDLVLPSGAVAHIVEAAKQDEPKPAGPEFDENPGNRPGAESDGDKPKRKRRTKAEIEADERNTVMAREHAAQMSTADALALAASGVAVTQGPVHAVVPALPAETGTQPPAGFVAAPPTGETPSDQAAREAQKEADPAAPAPAPVASAQLSEDSPTRAQIELRQAEILADPSSQQPQFVLTHSRTARQYIEQHGMAAYNETQTIWGLPADVMRYTPQQRALHLATMQVLGPLRGNGVAA
ncbi:hypothetical protein 2B_00008 [Ralstonia phage Bakoly]|uniref:Uncharacterized protein n=2 Tax=Bakolyvirus bakoly TaxID=2846039 RepID=A0A7G5BB89_9CAUD|nr:hypothetical protein KE333_gp08 [Ralstonia phage Bakoly]QMV32581.1 hypothetical protein 2B_00008 [Ralstonia phage Bakoly]QMV33562.1 hypothetical protein 30B_00055 [Ralstonia phage Jenny]